LKAGYSVDIFDHFGDWDLEKLAKSVGPHRSNLLRFRDHWDLLDRVDLNQYDGAIIAGGYETKIEWLRQLTSSVPVLGCPLPQLVRLQSAANLPTLSKLVERSGAHWPETLLQPPIQAPNGDWLVKSLTGSGGKHVRVWSEETVDRPTGPQSIYQRRVEGLSISALFAVQAWRHSRNGDSTNRSARCQLIGCTEQLVGEPGFGAGAFSYCGSIGPLQLDSAQTSIVERLGAEIASEFEICGVFGVDLILNATGIWLIDVNPRITASAEIYELIHPQSEANSFSVFQTHLDGCLGYRPTISSVSSQFLAKGILFCRTERGLVIETGKFERLTAIYEQTQVLSGQRIADIPQDGTNIPQTAPILTVFAMGDSADEARRKLLEYAYEFYDLLEA
jgi:predicted ATP-grasp superfamily ATP-dependent carboligase